MARQMAKLSLLILFCAACSSVHAQGTFPLKYEDVGPSGPHMMMAQRFAPALEGKPAELKAPPVGAVGGLAYFKAELGGKEVLFALDGAHPPKLYVDSDRDGDLSDEKACELPAPKPTGLFRKQEPERKYGPIPVNGTDKASTVRLCVQTFGKEVLFIRTAGCWTGEATLDGKRYPFAVVDADFNGRLGDVISFPFAMTGEARFDTLAFDFDGNRKLDEDFRSLEVMPFPKTICVKETYYSIRIAPDGSNVQLEKVTPEFGTLDVGTGDAELMLWSESGGYRLKGPEGKWRLPAGHYASVMLSLSRTDDAGSTWTLTSRGDAGKLQNFEVQPGQTLTVKLGARLSIKTDASLMQGLVYITLSLVGQGGEQYAVGVEKNGQSQHPPQLRILNESGRVLASGIFEYG